MIYFQKTLFRTWYVNFYKKLGTKIENKKFRESKIWKKILERLKNKIWYI
jgi:hypothetical protein